MVDKQKKRILHLFGSMNCGGAETMLMNIYRNMDMSGIHFDFLVHSQKKGYYDDEIVARGGQIYYIPSQGKIGIWRYLCCLRKFFKEYGSAVIVHSHLDWQGGIIALGAKAAGVKRIIVHSHASSWMMNEKLKYRMVLWLQKFCIFCCATDFWACSQAAADFLFYEKFLKKRHVQFIPNAINVERYMAITEADRSDVRNLIGASVSTLVIGHVGSISPVKNQSFLVDIAACLKSREVDFKMVFVGRGDSHYEAELKQKIKDLRLEEYIVFLGHRDDIAKVMSAFDVFAFPSIFEGLGMVVIEAQASGLPCIISEGVPKQADMGLGLVVQAKHKDIGQWTSFIIDARNSRCLDKKEIDNCLSQRGYNIKESTNQVKDLYLI